MYKDTVTVLSAEYPMFRDGNIDHVLMVVLATMFQDFRTNEKWHKMSHTKHNQIIQLFTKIQESLQREENDYRNKLGSYSLIEIGRMQMTYPLLEQLFYETEYQVNLTISPLKVLSSNEQKSLEMVDHLQRFNKTLQQKREEKIDKLIDE